MRDWVRDCATTDCLSPLSSSTGPDRCALTLFFPYLPVTDGYFHKRGDCANLSL